MEVLDLNVAQLGDGLYQAAQQTFVKQVQWTSTADLEDPESLERMIVDKCCFLIARSFENTSRVSSLCVCVNGCVSSYFLFQ